MVHSAQYCRTAAYIEVVLEFPKHQYAVRIFTQYWKPVMNLITQQLVRAEAKIISRRHEIVRNS